MNVAGSLEVPMTRSCAWQILTRPETLAQARAFRDVVVHDDSRFSVTVDTDTSVGVASFRFRFEVLERLAEEGVTLHGRGVSGQHAIDVDLTLALEDRGDASLLTWRAAIRLGGVLASVAQRTAPSVIAREIGRWLQEMAAGTTAHAAS